MEWARFAHVRIIACQRTLVERSAAGPRGGGGGRGGFAGSTGAHLTRCERERELVGGGVPEAREWRLHDRPAYTAVEPRHACDGRMHAVLPCHALSPQCAQRGAQVPSARVLHVHGRA